MYLTINQNYKVQFKEGCWTPFKFSKGGKELTVGKHKGIITKDSWVTSGKYFMNLESALKHIIIDTLSEKEEMSLSVFLNEYQQLLQELKETVKEAPCY